MSIKLKILIGIALILGGIGYAVYMYKSLEKKITEMSYMRTSSIKDTIDIVEQMSFSDLDYRHYVELKGNIVTDEPLTSPYSNTNCVFYDSRCYSVIQEHETYYDKEGNRKMRTRKKETELSHEEKECKSYICDGSTDQKITVCFESFKDHIDLKSGCDRFEQRDSDWSRNYGGYYNDRVYLPNNSKFLGYRLKEKYFPNNSPIYILGEVYKMGEEYFVGRSSVKPNKVSYKSEEDIIGDAKKKQWISIAIGAGVVLVGIIYLFA